MKCQSDKHKYSLKKLSNQEVELQYCLDHSGRTCCNNDDVLPIRQMMSIAKYQTDPKVTDSCFI